MAIIPVPRAFGGTLFIDTSEVILPASEINATMLARRGTVTLNPRTGAARFTVRRGTITWPVRKD